MIAAGPSAITPGMFTPPPFRYLDHIKIPSIKEAEMRHFKRFIESTGGKWTLSKNKKRSSMKVASGADASIMNYVTEKGYFLDGQGNAYSQTGGKYYDAGEYDLDVHGLPVPLAKKGQRKNLTIAGFLRPSGSGALTNKEFERALRIINTTSPNEFIRQQRENILIQQSRFGV